MLYIDIAWTKPDPAAAKADGYDGIIGYFSHDPSKDLTADYITRCHAAGESVGSVWETTETRATQGEAAGRADATEVKQRRAQLGWPASIPTFFAVDTDVPWTAVAAYFAGVVAVLGRAAVEPYGSVRIVEGFHATYGGAAEEWQTQAWSGTTVSPYAGLYQRVKHTRPPIPGVPVDSYDEDAVLHPVPLWGLAVEHPHDVTPAPAPTPPAARPVKGLPDMTIFHLPNDHEYLTTLAADGKFSSVHLSPDQASAWRKAGVQTTPITEAEATSLGLS